jgi:hypothetical protein
MQMMRANVFHGPNNIRVEEVPRPHAGADEAVIRIILTTICGTDLHILRGEYAVKPGLVIGHEPEPQTVPTSVNDETVHGHLSEDEKRPSTCTKSGAAARKARLSGG